MVNPRCANYLYGNGLCVYIHLSACSLSASTSDIRARVLLVVGVSFVGISTEEFITVEASKVVSPTAWSSVGDASMEDALSRGSLTVGSLAARALSVDEEGPDMRLIYKIDLVEVIFVYSPDAPESEVCLFFLPRAILDLLLIIAYCARSRMDKKRGRRKEILL